MDNYGAEYQNMGDLNITLGDVIRILYLRKWFLIAVTLVFGACVAGFLLTLEPSYRSDSALAVEVSTDSENAPVAPIPIDVLQDVANAPRTKRQVYEDARSQNLIPPELAFASFLQRLTSQIREPKTSRTGPVRVLVLSAQHADADVAKALANTWADAVLTTVNGMYEKQIRDILAAAETARESAAEAARLADARVTSLTLRANLETPEPVLAALSEQFSETAKEAALQEGKLRKLEGKVDVLKPRVEMQEVDGRWVGDALSDACLKTPDAVPAMLASLATSTLPLARLLQWTLTEEEALRRFEFTSGINVKKRELTLLQRELEDLQHLLTMLGDLNRKREAFQATLKATPGAIVLNKAITDDALWGQHLSGNFPKTGKTPVLRTEEANPAHSKLATQAVALDAQIRELEKRTRNIQNHEKEDRARILSLIAETKNIEEQMDVRKKALADARAILDTYAKEYREDRDGLRQTRRQMEEARRVFEQTRQQRNALLQEVHSLRSQAESYTLRMKDADRKVKLADAIYEKSSKNYIRAASQPQVTGETRSPSGAYPLFEAEVNPIRIGKSKRKTLMLAMALVFAALSAFVVVRDGILQE